MEKIDKAINWSRVESILMCHYVVGTLAENALRPFVVGRKNWLFSGNQEGARASAALFSLIETAKANEMEPYRYLRYLFKRLPVAKTTEDYKPLIPQYLSPEQLKLNA